MKTKTTTKKATKTKVTRKAKAPRPPFRVLVGRVTADGKKYKFERHAYKLGGEALESARKAIHDGGDAVREVLILINPEAK